MRTHSTRGVAVRAFDENSLADARAPAAVQWQDEKGPAEHSIADSRDAEIVADVKVTRRGRPAGPRMPCGWGCVAEFA